VKAAASHTKEDPGRPLSNRNGAETVKEIEEKDNAAHEVVDQDT
jgi:hypothetical protein